MFITFEGIEGSGKSTQAKLLRKSLLEKGHDVVLTREPGWGALGKLIRRMLLEEKDLELEPLAELCLFCADRAQHVKDFIKPKLRQENVVICDRFTDSTIVYQGYGRKLDIDLVRKLAKGSALGLKPDLTILLNLPAQMGLSRLMNRGDRTKMDDEPLNFHETIRQGYTLIAQKEPDRVKLVNAARAVEEIHEDVKRIVSERLTAESL